MALPVRISLPTMGNSNTIDRWPAAERMSHAAGQSPREGTRLAPVATIGEAPTDDDP